MLSRQEGSMMPHLENAHSMTGPPGGYHRMTFSVIWRGRLRQPVNKSSIGKKY